MNLFESTLKTVSDIKPVQVSGRVLKSVGMVFEASLPNAKLGSICRILPEADSLEELGIDAEVIGFRDNRVVLMPFGDSRGIGTGSWVKLKKSSPVFRVGDALLGRVLNAQGEPIDGKGPIQWDEDETAVWKNLWDSPSHPLERAVVDQPLDLGVRALNGLLTAGKGQRVGIMAGSGVGKSVLLGMMARHTSADINVIALIGERGREVREFIERDLGEEGLKRSVVIVATSDQSPLLRTRGAIFASAIAEYFRDRTKDVLLLMDSVTRFCMAQREIGLSLGEPPATKGYPPSVFSFLPKLLERAGTGVNGGSITGLYTVLVEGDDLDDPIADSARSILDGHVVLSRKIAQKNQFPAVDVLASTSRVFRSVTTKEHQDSAAKLREWMAVYAQAEDLINIGAYSRGSNPKVDQAIAVNERINQFLRQSIDEEGSLESTQALMTAIVRVGESQAAMNAQTQQKK